MGGGLQGQVAAVHTLHGAIVIKNIQTGSAMRSVAAMALLPMLAACGGDGVLTSFDAEKSRIRNALSDVVECVEGQTSGGGKYMNCRSPAQVFSVDLWNHFGGDRMEVVVTLGDGSIESSTMALDFRHVLDAYNFGTPDVLKCLDDKYNEKIGASFSVTCESVAGTGVTARITQVKKV